MTQLVKTKIRQSYDRYIEDILGISTPDPNDQNADTTHTDPSEGPSSSLSEKEPSNYLSFHTAAPSCEYYVQSRSQCKNKSKIAEDIKSAIVRYDKKRIDVSAE